ncbi:MAG: twin-arginine translocation signal domain-containing protein [Chitinophagaceae bacterium]
MKHNRRNFIKLTGAATTAALLSSLESVAAANKPSFTVNKDFELLILATDWGYTGSYDSFFAKIKADGYDGAETWCPGDEKGRTELATAVQKHGMKVGLLYGAGDSNPQKNYDEFVKTLNECVALNPIYINCHTAKDFFTPEELHPFFKFTSTFSQQKNIPVYHETHRGRALYSAPVTKGYIEKHADLRITFDVSHWCVVHESMLEDQAETLAKVLDRTDHIHARIGFQEGPQVNDPRAPEWEYAVKQHFLWWDKVVEQKKKKGERMTFLTEFGPPLYMPTLPYTLQPLSDQWAINVHMMKLLRKRYS